MHLIAFQAIPPLEKDGLPYWLFWTMLLVILLLLLFIFLRDKNLRLRISSFFASARRRSVLLQLRYQLRKEKQKKETALKKLGEKAWDADLHVEGAETVRSALGELVKRRDAAQMDLNNALAEMERHHKRLEEAMSVIDQRLEDERAQKQPFDAELKKKREEERRLRKLAPGGDIDRLLADVRKEIADLIVKVHDFERQIREIEAEKRESQREIAREVHFWKKKKEKIQQLIRDIEAQQEDFYLSLGRTLEEKKVDHPELQELHAEIDHINSRIATLHHRIETLAGG